LQLQFAQRASEQQTLNSPLAGIGARSPITVTPQTVLRAALETMSQAGIGSLVIAGEDRKPVGVFTRTDLLERVVLAQLPLTTPIGEAMTPNPSCSKNMPPPTTRCSPWRPTAFATFW
jgi:CBS domain-containing protein